MMTKSSFKRKKLGYTIVQNDILYKTDLSMKAKIMYVYFMSKPEEWTFYTSAIVNEFKESKKTIMTAINELIDYGLMTRTQVRNGNKYSHNQYELFDEKQIKECDKSISQKNEITTKKQDKEIVKVETDKYKETMQLNHNDSKVEYCFDDVWNLYIKDRRNNKQKSLNEWIKLSESEKIDALQMLKNTNYQEFMIKQGKYMPDFNRWIKNRRWEDEQAIAEYDKQHQQSEKISKEIDEWEIF